MTASNRLDGAKASATQRRRLAPTEWLRGLPDRCGFNVPAAASPDRGGARGGEDDEHAVADGPPGRLLPQPERRLDDQRIGEQRDEAAQVAGRVEKIRVPCALHIRGRIPPLQHGRARREREERQPDRDEQRQEQPGDRMAQGRVRHPREPDRQHRDREQQHEDVQRCVAPDAESRRAVRIRVAAQQDGLEEDQARVPHRGGAAEQRQHQARDHRLDEEHQKRAQKNRRAEERRQLTRTPSLDVGGDREGRHESNRRPPNTNRRRLQNSSSNKSIGVNESQIRHQTAGRNYPSRQVAIFCAQPPTFGLTGPAIGATQETRPHHYSEVQ